MLPSWETLLHSLGLDPRVGAVLACSGGADSVFLLELLARSPLRPDPLVVVHINHQLRGQDSVEDARWCQARAAQLGLECVVIEAPVDPRPAGLEARARQARRACWARVCDERGLQRLLLAHQRDDASETLVLRWLRGGELLGAPVLPSRSLWHRAGQAPLELLRPLLAFPREQIRSTLRSLGLSWREDASNHDLVFARNRARLEWLPSMGPSFAHGLLDLQRELERLASTLAQAGEPLKDLEVRHASARDPRSVAWDRAAWRAASWPVARTRMSDRLALHCALRPARAQLEAWLRALRSEQRGTWQLPQGWTLYLGARCAELIPPRSAGQDLPTELCFDAWVALPDGRRVRAQCTPRALEHRASRSALRVDLALRGSPRALRLRHPQPQDRFQPFGASRPTALLPWLQSVGIPHAAKGQLLLVLDGEEIIWVAGLRPSETRRLPDTASSMLTLELQVPTQAAALQR